MEVEEEAEVGGRTAGGRDEDGCCKKASGTAGIGEVDGVEKVGQPAGSEEEGVDSRTVKVGGDLEEELVGEGEERH